VARDILIIRHPTNNPGFYDIITMWVDVNLPELTPLLDVQFLPGDPGDWSQRRLLVPWLNDPVEQWSMEAYSQAEALAAECEARGIPVINRVKYLSNAGKLEGARRIAGTGLRTPRTVRIDTPDKLREFRETLLGLKLPLVLRNDWGHGPPMHRADTLAEARALPVGQIERPIVVEIIDVRDPHDGLHRKYRYVGAGDAGISHHLQASTDWVTRGGNRVDNAVTRAEELAYIGQPDPHHARFQTAMRALELDFVAFDYGYDRDGEVVVWEANPYPHIRMSTQNLTYRNLAIHRTLAAIVRLYLVRAGLPVPAKLVAMMSYPDPSGV